MDREDFDGEGDVLVEGDAIACVARCSGLIEGLGEVYEGVLDRCRFVGAGKSGPSRGQGVKDWTVRGRSTPSIERLRSLVCIMLPGVSSE